MLQQKIVTHKASFSFKTGITSIFKNNLQFNYIAAGWTKAAL